MQEALAQGDPLEEETATHSTPVLLPGKSQGPRSLEAMGLQRVRDNRTHTHTHTHTMLTQGGFVGTGCCSWKSEGPFLHLTLAPFSHSLFKLPSLLLLLLLFPLILLLHHSKRTQFIGISLHEDWARTMWFLPLSSIYLNSWARMAYIFLKHRSDHTYPQLSHLQWFLLPLRTSSL